MRKLHVGLVALLLGAAACASTSNPVTTGSAEDEIAEELADEQASLFVKDPRTLMALEERGLAFADVVGIGSPAYDAIASTITEDLRILRLKDRKSGVGFDFPHRQFDPAWLHAKESRFELVGLVNRTDRQYAGGCGELRLIYRLAYTGSVSASRLPMTMNVVFPQADDGAQCSTVAKRWLDAARGTPELLLAGPLAGLPAKARIEINLQAVRWPSNERPDMGGQAEYILRVFSVNAAGATPVPLENTPRTDLSPDERKELARWVGTHLDEIDRGTALVPEKFLAEKAIAVGPIGIARLANRPWHQLYENKTFAKLALPGTKQLGTTEGLLRRLDTMTCNGCHQARSIAGFHFLGEERDNAARLNALAIARSPHFAEELPWRESALAAIAAGTKATPRPFAEHGTNDGKYGAHCGLGDAAFAAWTCGTGYVCEDRHGDVVGTCGAAAPTVGDACESGRVTQDDNPMQDRVEGYAATSCGTDGRNARCNQSRNGFPDGMCRVDCTEAEYGKIVGGTICGPVPSAAGLTRCLTVDRKPFAECLVATNAPTYLRTCDRTEACRDDYACTRVPGGPPGIGACMPPYFAFQARVDGHIF